MKKGLKTNIAIDLAWSLASRCSFLGKFYIPKVFVWLSCPVRVARPSSKRPRDGSHDRSRGTISPITKTLPNDISNTTAADWWRGLLTMAYMTGWRIGQLFSLKWTDIDLDNGTAITRAEVTGNKGKRDERIPLHPVVLAHLRKLAGSFDQQVFPWSKQYRKL